MIDSFMPFRSFFKFEYVSTDNNVFRLHYKLTVIMLLVFTLLVTSKQFFGEPIHCMADNEKDIDKDFINTYCWIYGTYTLKSNFPGSRIYPGVGPQRENDELVWHSYYQWVCFVLLGQSVMFYAPRYLWKVWEGGKIKTLASGLASPIVTKELSDFRRSELISYIGYTNSYTDNMYALRYAFCEILNLLNVIGQIFLLDVFLGGSFHNYGAAVAAFTHIPRVPEDMISYDVVNPMDQYFPKLTKCWLRNFGPSGSPQGKDRLCVLALNIVNEKIFIVLWFWLLILAFVSILAVFFRILVFSLRPLRTVMIMGQLRHVKRSTVSKLVKRLSFGNWFVIHLLGKNMNPLIFKELILELSKDREAKTNMV